MAADDDSYDDEQEVEETPGIRAKKAPRPPRVIAAPAADDTPAWRRALIADLYADSGLLS